MNSFKLFGLKRTRLPDGQELALLCHVEDIFELHSKATEGKKDKNRVQKGDFLAN
jgi:hypothetical protein